jgi:glycerol-3-phosphate dehydrogenase (NAD(P)+)
MNISVLGAGAWGTALAVQAAARHAVCLWARDAQQAEAMRRTHTNERYLPDIKLPASLRLASDCSAALEHAQRGLFVIATPMSGLRETLALLPHGARALWLCKGFEAGTGHLGHEVAQQVCPGAHVGVLSGPSFAGEVARWQPTALVAASAEAAVGELAVSAFHSPMLRIYTSDDPVGVEVGGAVKNVLAIATGICDGMRQHALSSASGVPGLNGRAALITRGLAEMTRLGLALGARAETFMGLSGLGDLVLTATGDQSRNRTVGLQLAAGQPLARVLEDLGHVAEGVYSADTVLRRAHELAVDMPITEAVAAVLQGRLTPAQAGARLMGRDARAEA